MTADIPLELAEQFRANRVVWKGQHQFDLLDITDRVIVTVFWAAPDTGGGLNYAADFKGERIQSKQARAFVNKLYKAVTRRPKGML